VRGWAARALEDVPLAADSEPGLSWYPLQHVFGFTAFGVNAFVAGRARDVLVEQHDERASGQEELYVVIRGSAEFTLDGDAITGSAVFLVAVRDPTVIRSAVALEAGTTMLVFGRSPTSAFESTWVRRCSSASAACSDREKSPLAANGSWVPRRRSLVI
jgi:hypothetical protein